ncbi:O-acetyltransferase OatA [Rubripirellula lacrimiformis]|uniref:O-acetyltransferase OatA n=1 Tax=Rubripirellula lacrimiformis TaxID=1930273 RepID=A0A517N8Q4_9BACT|nr:acyltransferase [Rubripirellula lacrimiformis]QDT03523.1 O-acetyltransferase OatA [Rubripirellula lacrimiformis]
MTSLPPNAAQGRIASLDGLRAIAIALVLISHGSYSLPSFMQNIFLENGGLGVRIFFVLSGFLIYTLSSREIAKHGDFNVRNFYIRRVIRIFPAFYTYLALVAALSTIGYLSVTWQSLLCAGTFTMNLESLFVQWLGMGTLGIWVVVHYWTLAVEEQFYASWPLVIWLRARDLLWPVLWAVMLAGPISRVLTYALLPTLRPSIGFLLSYDAIAGGVLLGLCHERWPRFRTLFANHSHQWRRHSAVIASFSFILIASPLLNSQFGGLYRLPFGLSLEIAAITLLITLLTQPQHTWYFTFLNHPAITSIGVLSYSLYLYNMLFLDESRGDWITQSPQNFGVLFAAAIISYHLIEKPFFKLRRFARNKSIPETETETMSTSTEATK